MQSDARIGIVQTRPRSGTVSSEPGASIAVDRASQTDALRVTDVISDAFLDDPTWSWAFPDPTIRKQWWSFCIQEALRYPWTFKTQGFETVSVWIPPNCAELGQDAELSVPSLLRELAGDRASEVGELLDRFGQTHPRQEPHYYLSLLGTRRDCRGSGLGMALLEENIARIDADHMPAYLESSNPNNNDRYEAVGFVPVTSFRAPGDGPLVTGMWRSAR